MNSHMPRKDLAEALLNEAEGITRHELRTMSEGFSDEQRSILHWSRTHIEAHFAATWEHLYEPGVDVVAPGRSQRRVRRRKPIVLLDYDDAMERAHREFEQKFESPAQPGTIDIAWVQSRARDLIQRSSVSRYSEKYEWVETPESSPMDLRAVEQDIVSQYQDGIHVYERLLRTKADRTVRRIVTSIRDCAGIDITVPPVVSGRVVPLRLTRPTIWNPTRTFESLCSRRVS